MRVRDYTADRLRLTRFPLGLALGLAAVIALPVLMAWGYFRAGVMAGGLVMAGIALLLLVGCFGVFVRRTEIVLDRTAGTVTVSEIGLIARRRKSFSMQGLRGASLQGHLVKDTRKPGERRTRKRRDVRVWRPVLVWQTGRTEPLIEVYSSGKGAGTAAAVINGWMEGDATPRAPLPIDTPAA